MDRESILDDGPSRAGVEVEDEAPKLVVAQLLVVVGVDSVS
jgi:hypothetical protein